MAHELVVATALPPKVEDLSAGYLAGDVATWQSYVTFDVSGDEPEMQAAAAFRKEQKKLFLQGDIRNPILNDCPRFTSEAGTRAVMIEQLSNLMFAQTLRRSDNAPVELEDPVLDELLAMRACELGYVETAALLARNELPNDKRLELAEILKRASRSIYGMPNRDVALDLLSSRYEAASKLAKSTIAEVKDIGHYVLEHCAEPVKPENGPSVKLDEATVAYYQDILRSECEADVNAAFDSVEDKEVYEPEDMEVIFNTYLAQRGYDKAGWQAKIVANKTMCASMTNQKIVAIGDQRPESRRVSRHILKSMLHEIEVHVGRNVRGRRLGSGLAGSGLAHYVEFEEPLAGTTEDLYFGDNVSQRGVPATIGIAIAAGLVGHEQDFRDSYELMWRLFFAESYDTDEPLDKQMTKAQNSAYNNLVRIWRGMPTDVPGCVYTKDQSYENTNLQSYLHNGGQRLSREDFLRLFQAKYNAFIPAQDAYIRALTAPSELSAGK